ncbi:MAG: terminase, partial [Alphaproteobacteria bacterium]
AALSRGASVDDAVRRGKVGRRTFYDWRTKDKAFNQQVLDAMEAGTDVLEDEARRRAVDGVRKPVYQGGKRVGYVQEYSDVLLIFLLKARRPDKYRDRFEAKGDAGGGFTIRVDLS